MKSPEIAKVDRGKRMSLMARCARRHAGTREGRTTREIEIVALAAIGHTDKEIAERLNIQATTVNSYWRRILERCGARTRTEAVAGLLILEIQRLREQNAVLKAEQEGSDPSE